MSAAAAFALFGTLGTATCQATADSAVNTSCYGAFIPSFSWCSGYEGAGYNCTGDYCASSSCVGECYFCAIEYEGAALDAYSGRCCASLGPGGACEKPFPSVAPWNEDYLWPDHHPALIVEGPVAYPNGPHVWSNGSVFNESGAYAFTMNSPGGRTDKECPKLPSNTTFDTTKVKPISLREHGVAISNCALSCNWTAIAEGGEDPCEPGTVRVASVVAEMRCFYGGPGWLKQAGLGVCGYNCTALHMDSGAVCSQEDVDKDLCEVFCDPRDFPNPAL